MKVEPEFQRCWSGPNFPLVCFRGWYLDGKLPHSIFWVFFSVLDADPEGSIGFLFCGPVMYTFLEGRNLGVRLGKFIGGARLEQQREAWCSLLVSHPMTHVSAWSPTCPSLNSIVSSTHILDVNSFPRMYAYQESSPEI